MNWHNKEKTKDYMKCLVDLLESSVEYKTSCYMLDQKNPNVDNCVIDVKNKLNNAINNLIDGKHPLKK